MGTGSILVSGFALFAMFFGAGNLIFPPYLGMTGGSQWIAGFLSFFLVEILSCVGIHAMLHGGGSIRAMQKSVGAAFCAPAYSSRPPVPPPPPMKWPSSR